MNSFNPVGGREGGGERERGGEKEREVKRKREREVRYDEWG